MDSSVWNNWVRPLSDNFRFQPSKSRRSDFPAWLCVRRIRITRLPCEFPSEANERSADAIDCIYDTFAVVSEEKRLVHRYRILWRRDWRSDLVYSACCAKRYRSLINKAIERLIAKWGLAWVYRFLGLSIIVVGGVSHPTIFVCADKKASAMTLKPGVSLGRPSEGSMAHSTSREKGLIKSSRFIRILFACFIASYPFLIPPYVSTDWL